MQTETSSSERAALVEMKCDEEEGKVKSLDEILEYINAPESKGSEGVRGMSSAKSAKRLRQRQKKAEDRLLRQKLEAETKERRDKDKQVKLEAQQLSEVGFGATVTPR